MIQQKTKCGGNPPGLRSRRFDCRTYPFNTVLFVINLGIMVSFPMYCTLPSANLMWLLFVVVCCSYLRCRIGRCGCVGSFVMRYVASSTKSVTPEKTRAQNFGNFVLGARDEHEINPCFPLPTMYKKQCRELGVRQLTSAHCILQKHWTEEKRSTLHTSVHTKCTYCTTIGTQLKLVLPQYRQSMAHPKLRYCWLEEDSFPCRGCSTVTARINQYRHWQWIVFVCKTYIQICRQHGYHTVG